MSNFVYTEEVTGEIVQIPVTLLHHHPDNPRKDLGDLSELTDSIKAKGILQNLTVVPCEREGEKVYLVVIGNRRLEAAKNAGLETLPCIIASMTPAEQVQTMLLENIQRSDLTVYEQAKGFQMMIDFGDDVDTVSEKTGFSKTTIRRRLKMAELDEETMKKVSERQVSLLDFDKLFKLEDIDHRNEVLAYLGTSEFNFRLQTAMQREEQKKGEERWRQIFAKAGVKEIAYKNIWDSQYENTEYINLSGDESELEKKIEEGREYVFAFGSTYAYLRVVKEESSNDVVDERREREEAARRERYQKLSEALAGAYKLRKDFIYGISETAAKNHFGVVITSILDRENYYFDIDDAMDEVAEAFGFEFTDDNDTDYEEEDNELRDLAAASPYKTLLIIAYSGHCDSTNQRCYDWRGVYERNDRLESIYAFLEKIGYQISSGEKDLLDGSSELYDEVSIGDAEDLEEEDLEDEVDPEDEEDDATDDEIVESLKEMYDDDDE